MHKSEIVVFACFMFRFKYALSPFMTHALCFKLSCAHVCHSLFKESGNIVAYECAKLAIPEIGIGRVYRTYK